MLVSTHSCVGRKTGTFQLQRTSELGKYGGAAVPIVFVLFRSYFLIYPCKTDFGSRGKSELRN
jgi:hypothetical protein